MSRFFYVVVLLFFTQFKANAQFVSVEVGIDGFTCSMCAMSVEKAILQLSFVSEVKMNLNEGTAVIFLRENKKVSIHEIANKVYNSGFSVRYIYANYNFPEISLKDFAIFSIGEDEFHFIKVEETIIKGLATVIFLNKRLLSKKEYASWAEWIKKDIQKNGKKENVYYVTLLRGQ